MIDDGFPALMTVREAADFLGVAVEDIAIWARGGQILAAARSEAGELLFYRWRVERDGPALAATEPVRLVEKKKSGRGRGRAALLIRPRQLPCGCTFAGSNGDAAQRPVWLCADARALQSAERLTAAFAEAAPHDAFFRRLAAVTHAALARHLGLDCEAEDPAPAEAERSVPRHLPAPIHEVSAAIP